MKQKNKVKRLRARQVAYASTIENLLKNDPGRVGGYHKPGSLKK